MKEWPLTKNQVALVDDDIFVRLLRLGRRWQASERQNGKFYATSDPVRNGQQTRIYLHRWILDAPAGKHVDHINGDGLDNQRENLRLVTRSGNLHNQTKPTRAATGYRGVRAVPAKTPLWAAFVNHNNKQKHLGCFSSPEAAAVVRDAYVGEHYPTAPRLETLPMTLEDALKLKCEPPKSKTGHPNIRLKEGRYETSVRVDGKRVYVGKFDTLEEALAAQARHPH